MILHNSEGRLSYRKEGNSYGLTVQVDQGISDFYRSLIPKYYDWQQQKYPAHITVVRIHKEVPKNLEHWGKYNNKKIKFAYSGMIHDGTVYWWLNAFSTELEDIRLELGLPVRSEYTLPPEGFTKCFHITLSNKK
jgi:hypothetical protein